MNFPKDFVWGAATASYQIEGAASTDGRGPSIWDTFSKTPGKVFNGDTGDIACDHYNRFEEDIAIMKEIGLDAYRFSISWSRLFPEGDNRREQRGFDFYNRLIDKLLEAGITPLPTMFHWDLPQTLQDVGGWANRDVVFRFADYVTSITSAYSDRVNKWITLNEPWCFTWLGYMSGVHAPGVKNLDQAVAAAHHSALAHGLAVKSARAVKSGLILGQSLNMTNYIVTDPNNQELLDLAAYQDAHINRWWTEAELTGEYPSLLVDYFGDRLAKVLKTGDNSLLKTDSDFLGINYYSDSFLSNPGPDDKPAMDGGPHPFPQRASGRVPEPVTDMGWPITPDGLKNLLLRIKRDWPQYKSVAVTENGAAYDYEVEDGQVNDHKRVDYIAQHIEKIGEAIEAGSAIDSYFVWSLLDNFEWAEGYRKRFGIIHVDFETMERTPKLSSLMYKKIVASNGANIKEIVEHLGV